MTTAAEGKTHQSAQAPETGEMLHIPRVIDYAFKADCTLYLENETLVQREIEGKWYTIHVLNDVEWQEEAEHTGRDRRQYAPERSQLSGQGHAP